MGKKDNFEREEANKRQRDETRKRGGWKDKRNAARRNKTKRNEFFQGDK